jgi:cytochrome P450
MSGTAQLSAATAQDHGCDEITQAMTTPQFRENPYPLYERLRREQPVFRSSRGIWYLTRYADVDAALHDPRLSNNRERTVRWAVQYAGTDRITRVRMRLRGSILSVDPPDHTRVRTLVSRAFATWRMDALRPRIERIVADLLDTVEAAGPCFDLIAALACPLPIAVICELLGIPTADRGHVRRWAQTLDDLEATSAPAATAVPAATALERIEQVASEIENFLRDLIRARQAQPGNDLLSALVTARQCDDRLSEDELLSTCLLLLATGHDAPINVIGNGMLALLRNPDELRRLQDNPSLIRSAVEELLRYDSPIQMRLRIVAETVEVRGQILTEGEAVFVVLGSANRDPDQFPDPDRLDLTRPALGHLSFGDGPHFCVGARLVRLEAQVAIGMLVRRFPSLQLDTDSIDWRRNPPNLRGLASLPVAF